MSQNLLIDVGLFTRPPEVLSAAEQRWVGYYPYLLSKGYQLRPRYRPGWVPSWHVDGSDPMLCEDSWDAMPYRVLDALHIPSQQWVMLKMIRPSSTGNAGLYELDIIRLFSTGGLSNDPRNHVIPCLDSFPIPDVEGGVFYVMPLLTEYNRPRFWCLAEVYDLLDQLFEGLSFMHENGVAHCDIAGANIMLDGRPLYHEQFHPLNHEFSLDGKRMLPMRMRTGLLLRYYYIDFGLSAWNRSNSPKFMVEGTSAREPAPEQVAGNFYDPFAVDVYQLGALMRRDLLPEVRSLGFLLPLARAMTIKDPERRISLSQAHEIMHKAFQAQGGCRMRWPIIPQGASIAQWVAYTIIGMRREVAVLADTVVRICRNFCRNILGV